jgi:hypothetical protein
VHTVAAVGPANLAKSARLSNPQRYTALPGWAMAGGRTPALDTLSRFVFARLACALTHSLRRGQAARMSASGSREPIRLLVFSASLRRGSLNTRLAELAAVTIETNDAEVDRASLRAFDVPSYDADVQDDEGPPAGADR